MADLKISELPLISNGAVQPDKDFIALADTSASETKKVTPAGAVLNALAQTAANGGIPEGSIDPDKVDWDGIDPATIDGEAIKDGTLDGSKLIDGTVTGVKLLDGTIDASTKLEDNSIIEVKYAPGSVSTRALIDANVTGPKLAAGAASDNIDDSGLSDQAISGDSIQIGTLDSDRLKDATILNAKIADDTIDASAKILDNSVTEAKYAPVSVSTRALADLSVTGAKLAPGAAGDNIAASGFASESIDGDAIKTGTLDGDRITDGTVLNAKIADDTIDADAKLTDNSITETKYAPGSVSTRALEAKSVTNAQLAAGAAQANIDDSGLSDQSISGDAVQIGTLKGDRLTDGTITGVKIADATIDAATKLADNSVVETKYAPGSVSTRALTDLSVTNTKLATGAAIANIEPNTLTGSAIVDGSITNAKLQNIQSGAIGDGAVTGDKIAINTITAENIASDAIENRHLNDNVTDPDGGLTVTTDGVAIANTIIAGSQAGINYDEHGLVTSVAADGLVPRIDLPLATDTEIGAVSVPADGGLAVNGTGELRHTNVVTPATFAGISYDANGHVTSTDAGGKVPSAYMPVAGTAPDTIGAIYVPSQDSLTVDADGALRHVLSGASAGTYTKVTIDTTGHVTQGNSLQSTDIPNIDADKITTGELDTPRIKDEAITAPKMSDYSTCLMQEDFPGSSADYYLGMLWWQPSTAQLRVYSRGSAGNNWSPVGFGALQANNLRWGGVFDAAAGTVSIVTDFGTTAGLTAGGAIPAPSNDLSGLYLICQTEGNNVNQPAVSADTFTPGDWLLCINEVQGYVQIDSGATGGGGGGGSSYLSTLLDVSLTSLKEGERLQADASGIWSNTSVMDGGTF